MKEVGYIVFNSWSLTLLIFFFLLKGINHIHLFARAAVT